jgi:hypothetical protein
MKRVFLTTLFFLLIIGNISADEITFVAQAPKSVVVNQQFRLTFKVNRANVKEPTIPDLSDFNILTGPHRSTQQNYQFVNGKSSKEESVTFTYILMAEKEGEFRIPAASIMVDGKKYSSNPLRLKVLPPDKNSSSQSQGGGNSMQMQNNGSSTNINDDDLFVRATLSMGKVYEQEAVLLTYKVYSTVNLTNLSNPTPDLKDFHIQEVQLPREKHFELEHYNGRNYNTVVWRQFVLFPQQSGVLEIPSLTFESVIAVQSRRSFDPFEMMFNGGPSYVEIKKNLTSNKLTLDVKKLPAGRPAGFSDPGASDRNRELDECDPFSLRRPESAVHPDRGRRYGRDSEHRTGSSAAGGEGPHRGSGEVYKEGSLAAEVKAEAAADRIVVSGFSAKHGRRTSGLRLDRLPCGDGIWSKVYYGE